MDIEEERAITLHEQEGLAAIREVASLRAQLATATANLAKAAADEAAAHVRADEACAAVDAAEREHLEELVAAGERAGREREADIIRRLAGEWGEIEVGPIESLDDCVQAIHGSGTVLMRMVEQAHDWQAWAMGLLGKKLSDWRSDKGARAAVDDAHRKATTTVRDEGYNTAIADVAERLAELGSTRGKPIKDMDDLFELLDRDCKPDNPEPRAAGWARDAVLAEGRQEGLREAAAPHGAAGQHGYPEPGQGGSQ